jgi:hypothetical protein
MIAKPLMNMSRRALRSVSYARRAASRALLTASSSATRLSYSRSFALQSVEKNRMRMEGRDNFREFEKRIM